MAELSDRTHALREIPLKVREGGRASIPDVYGGLADKFPLDAPMEEGIQIKPGPIHVEKYSKPFLEMIGEGKIDTTYVISHRLPLEQAPVGYKMFKEKQDEVTKAVLKPDWSGAVQ